MIVSFEKRLVELLAICIAIRPLIRSPRYSKLLVCIAGVTILVTTADSFHNKSSLLPFAMAELSILLAMELAMHFHVLSKECLVAGKERADTVGMRFNMLLWICFIGLVIYSIFAATVSVLFSMWAVSVLANAVGFMLIRQRSRLPISDYQQALHRYVFYPNESELAPGQISTPSGTYYSRAAMFGITAGAMLAIGISNFLTKDTAAAIGWIPLPFVLISGVSMLIIGAVGQSIEIGQPVDAWRTIVRSLRTSDNPIERNSLFMGYVASDHSPVVADRSLLFQHAHVLGGTGTNKSSMGLAPLIEQLISFGDSTVIIIDLKADSPELLYAAEAAIQSVRVNQINDIPLKIFSLENGTRTHLFNPFLTTGWTQLSILERTDVLCTSCGLAYGFEYGRSFFTSSNSAVIREANLANPNAMSFRQLYVDVARLLQDDAQVLLPELRRAGVHAMEVIGRLASYEALNAIPDGTYEDAIFENQIQLADYFDKPGVAYFRLPSTTASIGAPSIARLILFFLIIAGKTNKRKNKVHVIIDEFQRMASENLDQLLQMARSHDIGLVLCNQSLSDLSANSSKVFHAVNGNCAIRQWFSVKSNDDLKLLQELMGTHEQVQITHTYSSKDSSRSYRTEHVPRARITDLHAMSENPNLSVIQISGSGRGYARYSGIPFVSYNDYHVSPEEYASRKDRAWPSDLPGMMESKETSQADPFVANAVKRKPNSNKKNPRFKDKREGENENPEDLFS